jgi:hypothetical protein
MLKIFLQEQRVSTQTKGPSSGWYSNEIGKWQYASCLCIAIFNLIVIPAWCWPFSWVETYCSVNIIITDTRAVFGGTNVILFIVPTHQDGHP